MRHKLVCKGGEVNATLPSGETPLTIAIQNDYRKTISALVDAGADVNLVDRNGLGPFHAAIRSGNQEVISLLMTKADINMRDGSGLNPLQLAVLHGNKPLAQDLVKEGADLHASRDMYGETPLELAVCNDDVDIVLCLLEAGARQNVSDFWGNTPLMQAAARGLSGMVKVLLSSGEIDKTLKKKNRAGHTCLSLAANHQTHNCYVIKELVKAGMSFYKSWPDDEDLITMVKSGCLSCVLVALEHGLSINKVYASGQTAFFYAVAESTCLQCRTSSVVQETSCYGLHSLTKKNLEIAKLFIEKGADMSLFWNRMSFGSMRSNKVEAVYELCIRAYGFADLDPLKTGYIFRSMLYGKMDRVAWLFTFGGYKPTTEDLTCNNEIRLAWEAANTGNSVQITKMNCWVVRIVQETRNPRPLKILAAQQVRKSVRFNVIYATEQLPLPKDMRRLVTLEDALFYAIKESL